jgi:hypothetical protein
MPTPALSDSQVPGLSISQTPPLLTNYFHALNHALQMQNIALRAQNDANEAFTQLMEAISNPRQSPLGTQPESPQSRRGVFSSRNGQPILVFVQIDTQGRHEIVRQIKVSLEVLCALYDANALQKNGGKITADIPKAAFVILNPRSTSYQYLRQEADDSERTIVQTSFVTESIKQGHLLDPNDFLLHGVTP